MDHVANPNSYEPQDSNLPPGTRAGVTVHYSATTISDIGYGGGPPPLPKLNHGYLFGP